MVVHHVVVEVDVRCVVLYASQHIVVPWSMVKTDDADVVHLVDVARLVGRWRQHLDSVSMEMTFLNEYSPM